VCSAFHSIKAVVSQGPTGTYTISVMVLDVDHQSRHIHSSSSLPEGLDEPYTDEFM